VRRAAALPLTLGLLLAIAPAADALSLRATAHERGRIALRVQAQPGVELTVRDDLTGEQRTLAPSAEETVLRRFAVWSCASAQRAACRQCTNSPRCPRAAPSAMLLGTDNAARRSSPTSPRGSSLGSCRVAAYTLAAKASE